MFEDSYISKYTNDQNKLIIIPYNYFVLVVNNPLYAANNQGFCHCSGEKSDDTVDGSEIPNNHPLDV